MGQEKYKIIIDTNFLGQYDKNRELISPNFKYWSVSKNIFLSLIDFVNSNSSLVDNIHIAIPEIVIEELKEQQKRAYNKNLAELKKSFNKLSELDGFELKTIEMNYNDHLNAKINAFLGKYNIERIPFPKNETLPKLIQKVLKKHKPFYKDGKKDSGFKDALIWESILEYCQAHKNFNYVFLSRDPDFNNTKLLSEFKSVVGKELILKQELSKVKALIDEKVELNLEFNKILSLYNQDTINKIINILGQCYPYITFNTYQFRIIDYYLSSQIDDIKKESDNKYIVSIPCMLKHETEYTGQGVLDDIYANYEYHEFEDILRLEIEKNGNNYYLTNIYFNSDKINQINKFQKTELSNIYEIVY